MTTSRPDFGIIDPRAHDAVAALATALQHGLDASDADAYDAMLADDVLWGSPKGVTLQGFSRLNAIHRDLMPRQVAPESEFRVDRMVSPAIGVVVAQIGRHAVDGGFSEMAMYTLVERDGRWWVVGGQNTPITV